MPYGTLKLELTGQVLFNMGYWSSTPNTVTEWLSLKLEFGRNEQHWIDVTYSNKRTSRSDGVALKASAAVLTEDATEGS